ncbi:MAG: YdcF family protein [Ardenticatenaceae bacterium]|nr:YdcF family protein [Ardenticatenaceae bacterium]MCB9444972.1 YdcF family protein [Ardenticatenaceae bacterium]
MKRKWLTFVVLLLVGLFVFTAAGIYRYAPDDEGAAADAAIVLGAAVWGERPSPVFQERINHAINLYEAGSVEKIIFTGGSDGDGRSPESIIAQQYAIEQGVAAADILLETESYITWENLVNAQAVAVENGLSTFIIVSDPLHMKRAMLMAEDLGMTAYASPTPTTRYRSWQTQFSFLMRETFFYLLYGVERPFT